MALKTQGRINQQRMSSSSRVVDLWIKRKLFGIGILAMLARALPPIPSASTRPLLDHVEIVGCEGREGFNRRVSISVLCSDTPDIRPIGAPKLMAGADGIESVRYDFGKISLVTFFLGKKVTSSIKMR